MSTQQQHQLTQPDCAPDPVDSVAPDSRPLPSFDAGSDSVPPQEDAITCMYNSLILLRIAFKEAVLRRFRGTPD